MEHKIDDMEMLSGLESHGGGGIFKGFVFVKSKKYDALSKETKTHISFEASDYLQIIQNKIEMEWAKVHEAKERNDHVTELTEIFKSAGFNVIHVEAIDSQYCSKACCYKWPWVIVTTQKGRIKLGWRKRVINLDWSESDIKAIGMELFKGENVTTGEHYIHCWGKDKAIEYLKKLNSVISI
ncbi:MAG: hypothetical protein ACTSSP_00780 [Candidatus Asgardarchaeia archaeon]